MCRMPPRYQLLALYVCLYIYIIIYTQYILVDHDSGWPIVNYFFSHWLMAMTIVNLIIVVTTYLNSSCCLNNLGRLQFGDRLNSQTTAIARGPRIVWPNQQQ